MKNNMGFNGFTAVCKRNTHWYGIYNELEIGKTYEVTYIEIGGSLTNIYLKGINGCFNSTCFEIYKNNKKHDIFNDPEINPYL